MKDYSSLKDRYLRDALPIRLGNLASNLARIKSRLSTVAHSDIADDLLRESQFFIEWTAADADADVAAQLAALQVELARWRLRLGRAGDDADERRRISEASGIWSERVLDWSGLLTG
ncbi:hypothetical protein [Lyngbya sp. CCY1209]|uniref:hypothetical protein n=1 Tax=Lyngbya sp. CCY1209 TaxID=2886103 RepID=UPI002D20674F|nr:hypothetical protein [Lyngbya sp. CCY1209]MEB3882806.1 hypothetical protein [Lyngbya sp. CCY1209]